MMVGFLGTAEIAVILVLALLVFGPQKLPEIGRQIGSAYRELNRMRNEVTRVFDLDDLNGHNRYDSHDYNQTYPPYNNGSEANHALPTYDTPEGTTATFGGGARAYSFDDTFVAPPGPAGRGVTAVAAVATEPVGEPIHTEHAVGEPHQSAQGV